jgi:acyl-activating enzyme 14
VTKILNGGGGLSLDLINEASQLFPHAAVLSAYGMCSLPVSSADS